MQTQSDQRQHQAAQLKRARAGDSEALAAIYEDHVDGLWAFVFYRVGRDPVLCEDVVSETFLSAVELRDAAVDYDPARGSLRTWLCQRSRNLIRKHRRALRRAHALAHEQAWERIDSSLLARFQDLDQAPLSDEILVREQTRELVTMTVANLPDDYRDALERKYLQGQSTRELAAQFELSEAAAKSLLARARRAFRDAFTTLAEAFSAAPDSNPATTPTSPLDPERDHVRA